MGWRQTGARRRSRGAGTGTRGNDGWTAMELSFLLMGTFLDDTAMLVIVAPLYVPLQMP